MDIRRFLRRVEELLRLNYEALGFSLNGFRVYPDGSGVQCDLEDAGDEAWKGERFVVFCDLGCPCGGKETAGQLIAISSELFQFVQPVVLEEMAKERAHEILRFSASREHLEEDVAAGRLPASALEGAVYEGKLLS